MIGDRAPNFLFATVEGRWVQQADLRGKPFVLFFFASWCEYCVKQAPDIEKLYRRAGRRNPTPWHQRLSGRAGGERGASGSPHRWRESADVGGYGASHVPFTVFVDGRGRWCGR
jgi:hypothetical protein